MSKLKRFIKEVREAFYLDMIEPGTISTAWIDGVDLYDKMPVINQIVRQQESKPLTYEELTEVGHYWVRIPGHTDWFVLEVKAFDVKYGKGAGKEFEYIKIPSPEDSLAIQIFNKELKNGNPERSDSN